jgi:hypothetical protein
VREIRLLSRRPVAAYGKPPRHTRFKKGQSGNPRGRPSGSKNLRTLLNEALNEPVVVTEEGRRRKITKREAIVTQLVNRSATADLRALKILLDTLREIEPAGVVRSMALSRLRLPRRSFTFALISSG